MKKDSRGTARVGLLGFASILGALLVACARVPPGTVALVMETEVGAIEILVDSARAPVTAANFLRYADAGLLEGGPSTAWSGPTTSPTTAFA